MLLDVSDTDLLSCCSVAATALERRGGKSKYPAEIVLKPSGSAGGVHGAGVLWTPSCWCACTHAGEDQWDVAVVSRSPDPAAPWFSVTLTAAWEEPASWASWLYLV